MSLYIVCDPLFKAKYFIFVFTFSAPGAERSRPVCGEWKPRDSMWLCREAAPQGVGPMPGVADGLLPCPWGRGYRGRVRSSRPKRGTEKHKKRWRVYSLNWRHLQHYQYQSAILSSPNCWKIYSSLEQLLPLFQIKVFQVSCPRYSNLAKPMGCIRAIILSVV